MAENGFEAEEFLKKNYDLFAIMGVFGAVAIYLIRLSNQVSQIPQEAIQMGVVGSFLIFFFVLYSIIRKLLHRRGKETFMNLFKFQMDRHDTEFLFLLSPLSLIGLSFILILSSYYTITNILPLGLFALVGWTGFGMILRNYNNYPENKSENLEWGDDVSYIEHIRIIDTSIGGISLLPSFIILFISLHVFASMFGMLPIEMPRLTVSSFYMAVIAGSIVGATGAIFVYSLSYLIYSAMIRFKIEPESILMVAFALIVLVGIYLFMKDPLIETIAIIIFTVAGVKLLHIVD
ncbi:hypothetical protein HTZ84_09445 [Haloterrigena sp. SYSU A558-1]|uniref:Uncharacterized protein n=1 Tax=Haloterrigena gelatinilytica TaxID=2741724 RepID=A0ABX2LBI4_9EURY|nr:hypothetical protein [Haloterrigena gelatinilytica]NUC72529.1 hypothetical protein [Haloterrigena gelatinilytica]